MNDFVSLSDINPEELQYLLNLTAKLKERSNFAEAKNYLSGKSLGMIFTKSSTRTRVSFETGIFQLGGQSLFLSSQDIQLGRGESIEDTAKVLSRYLDGIMIRTFSHQDVIDLAAHATIPVINGLTDLEHPCQALADLFTIKEKFGKLKGLKLAYVGDGNNVANSLLQACALAGMHIAVASPKSHTCNSEIVDWSENMAFTTGGSVTITTDAFEAVKDANAVYTDTWISMGQEAEKAQRIKIFEKYQVNKKLMSCASDDAIFLHCLPAYRDYEVTAEVIDGPQSVVFDEAENRLHVQKAVMVAVMS